MRTGIQEELELYMSKSVAQASNREIYEALLLFVQKLAAGKRKSCREKEALLHFGRVFDRKTVVKQYDQSRYL